MQIVDLIKQPWPWYVSGPLIGLTVPLLLVLGNRSFGISSSLRHVCAAFFPGNISFFKYDWKKEKWNLYFAAGIIVGGFATAKLLVNHDPVTVDSRLLVQLSAFGIRDHQSLMPPEIFSWEMLLHPRSLLIIVGGGMLVGFGTRYAGGCTSGHSIMGLSNLQWPSLVATICFMVGGILMANILLPVFLSI